MVIEVEEEVVADMVTGLDYALGPYFELQALVPGSGEREIRATAYDPMGNVQGEWEGTLFL